MTDDRLNRLLAEASDLVPSAALRGHVGDLVSTLPSEGVGVRGHRTPWFALSGLTAALAVAAFVAIPRKSYAEGLLERAAGNGAGRSARVRSYSFVGGAWRPERRGILVGRWRRYDERGGGFRLDTPEGSFQRSGADGPVFRTDAPAPSDDGLTLGDHLRFLKGLGYRTIVSSGPRRREAGRDVQDVTIDLGGRHERETVTIDLGSELPLRLLTEAWLGGRWTPTVRAEATYPGPLPGSREFWAGIDRRRVVDAKELTALWAGRLAPVQRSLRLSGGAVLKVRDLRVLPTGDVLMLYTGPANLLARLDGEDGTRFGRAWFDPNDGRTVPRTRPPMLLDGEPLRGLWFVPLEEGARAKGRVRLEIAGAPAPRSDEAGDPDANAADAEGQRGTFLLDPVVEASHVPAWADAIDNRFLNAALEPTHDEVRLIAAYDRWLDPQGRSVEGTLWRNPRAGWWISNDSPRPGLRHDPKASAAAAEAFRTMVAHAKAEGREINPKLVEAYLPRFEREARGE